MPGPRKQRKSPATGQRRRASILLTGKVPNPLNTTPAARPQHFRSIGEVVEVMLGSLRTPTQAEQRELRRIWWRQRRLGFTFPAQRGVIVIEGGRR